MFIFSLYFLIFLKVILKNIRQIYVYIFYKVFYFYINIYNFFKNRKYIKRVTQLFILRENYPKGQAGQNNYQKWWYLLIILEEDFNRLNIPNYPLTKTFKIQSILLDLSIHLWYMGPTFIVIIDIQILNQNFGFNPYNYI